MTDDKPVKKGDTRARAARIILRWMEESEFPDRLMADETRDRGFLMEVTYGAVKWKRRLEWVLDRLAARKPDPLVRAHLLAGLYQIFHMDHVEPYALVHETVEAVKRERGAGPSGFVNALLRRAIREKDKWERALREAPPAVRESHPDTLAARWTARWGAVQTAAVMAWDNERPAVAVRLQRSRTTAEKLEAVWTRAGVPFERHPAFPDRCWTLGRGRDVTRLPGWKEGWFAVQDPSTLVPVDLLNPAPGERVLDACCAPGGKLVDIADRMGGAGLTGLDVSGARLERVRENLDRLRIRGVTLSRGDAGDGGARAGLAKAAPFDAALVDAPCTNTGVLRRRPDARWRFTDGLPGKMAVVQMRLLDGVAGRVRPGGRIVYGTCSVEPEENNGVAAAWTAAHPDWRLADERAWTPGEHGTDGVYAALLVRAD